MRQIGHAGGEKDVSREKLERSPDCGAHGANRGRVGSHRRTPDQLDAIEQPGVEGDDWVASRCDHQKRALDPNSTLGEEVRWLAIKR